MEPINSLYDLKKRVEEMCKVQEEAKSNTIRDVIEDKQLEINQLYDIIGQLKLQLEDKDKHQEQQIDHANAKYSDMKQKLIGLQDSYQILEDKYDQLKNEILLKDDTIHKLKKEKEERAKFHLDEIERLKLEHQQELYLLKMRGKK